MQLHLSWVLQQRKRHFGLKNAHDWFILMFPDVCTGVLLYCAFTCLCLSYFDDLTSLISHPTIVLERIGSHLNSLLKWLHGAPAGFKLNRPLNDFLGYFYSYHIFIWANYVELLASFITPILVGQCLLASLLGGFSMVLAMISDMLLVVFPHMICFYVYATKLYRMELRMFLVCFRLFRGQKWNPLRRRVDSVQYDFEQLFMGTLLFTVALFVFPTICVYYIVFLLLYLPLVALRYWLFALINILIRYPFYISWLRFKWFFNNVFRMEASPDGDTIMKLPIWNAHQAVGFEFWPSKYLLSFSHLLMMVLQGEVISL